MQHITLTLTKRRVSLKDSCPRPFFSRVIYLRTSFTPATEIHFLFVILQNYYTVSVQKGQQPQTQVNDTDYCSWLTVTLNDRCGCLSLRQQPVLCICKSNFQTAGLFCLVISPIMTNRCNTACFLFQVTLSELVLLS